MIYGVLWSFAIHTKIRYMVTVTKACTTWNGRPTWLHVLTNHLTRFPTSIKVQELKFSYQTIFIKCYWNQTVSECDMLEILLRHVTSESIMIIMDHHFLVHLLFKSNTIAPKVMNHFACLGYIPLTRKY